MPTYMLELDMAEPDNEIVVQWMQKHGIDRQLISTELGPGDTYILKSLRRESLEAFVSEWYDSGDDETNRLVLDCIKEVPNA